MLPVQTLELQSPFSPQALPWSQFGEQAGGRHVPPVQTPDPQSLFDPQDVSWVQLGAQAGALHDPFTQDLVAHWLLFVQAVPLGQLELEPQLIEQLSPVYPVAHVHVPSLHVP